MGGCAVTPQPFNEAKLTSLAERSKAQLEQEQVPASRPITLHEAMARAIKHNLDHQVEIMQVALRERELRVAHYSKLPNLVANAGFADRDNYSGGSSVRLIGPRSVGEESLTASSSSERYVQTADLKFSWHILDFGLSWIRARQAADKALLAEEARRRVVLRIIEEVRTTYWRAVTAARLIRRLSRLDQRVERALRDNQRLIGTGESSPLAALTYERELIEIQREIRQLHAELSTAKSQLAALMNIAPGKRFSVMVPGRMTPPKPIALTPRQMVKTALTQRSELREVGYNKRINERDAEAAILEMLPGVSFSTAPNWNSNDYLFNSNWVSWGAQASWNLIKVFSYPARKAEIDAKEDLLNRRALAVTMAVMTQVHVSRIRLFHARRKFVAAARLAGVQQKIVYQIRQALAAGKVSEQTAIREEMNLLVSETKRDLAYAEIQSAYANVFASMGVAATRGVKASDHTVADLTAVLRNNWRRMGDT